MRIAYTYQWINILAYVLYNYMMMISTYCGSQVGELRCSVCAGVGVWYVRNSHSFKNRRRITTREQ